MIQTSDLIFPEASHNFSHTLLALKKSRLSIRNRLASINEDATFAQKVSDSNQQLPLIANERCGSWYIAPERKAGSVYFKSTDGHQSEWKFSTRRLNLELLVLLSKYGGAIVVDSTRRGKSMPDALSKTIPVWCAVMNSFLFPEDSKSHNLVVDPRQVAASEEAQICHRLDNFRMDLAMLGLSFEKYAVGLKKPMRPYFITRDSDTTKIEFDPSTVPIICCSVSSREKGDNDTYIQGAGDDSENWSRGLTADLFWNHRNRLTPSLDEVTLIEIVDEIVSHQQESGQNSSPHFHQLNLGAGQAPIDICDLATLKSLATLTRGTELPKDNHMSTNNKSSNDSSSGDSHPYDLLILICDPASPEFTEEDESQAPPPSSASLLLTSSPSFRRVARHTVRLRCKAGKVGSRALRMELGRLQQAMLTLVGLDGDARLLFACETAELLKDLGVGAALAASVLVSHVGRRRSGTMTIDKTLIRTHLAHLSAQFPAANPSRATLQSVNTFLMQSASPD